MKTKIAAATVQDFLSWLKVSRPRDVMIYLVAEHAVDNPVAGEAMRAYERGDVSLTKRRSLDNPDEFEHIAIRKHNPPCGATKRHLPGAPLRHGRA